MQFVNNGPDVPERLLQAHEDGQVVFFCGAGISSPAELPSFDKLVTKLYVSLKLTPKEEQPTGIKVRELDTITDLLEEDINEVQRAAIEAGQLDTTISLLEADIVGGRERVRQELVRILTPKPGNTNATATHEALLTLGKFRNGQTRLITTNFDRLFEQVITTQSLPIERFQAPLMPVKKSHWNGLIYLHGLLSNNPTPSELDRLVLSSGDFGLAYLIDRWATRFVSQLFRNYTVCFIGYSLNDPILRYMADALAADRLLGQDTPEMFAFGGFSEGKEESLLQQWLSKNVTPIPYRDDDKHAYLHQTLRSWAQTYRDGVLGKERIIVENAMKTPRESTKQDDFVGRMLWALSDPSGLPAKRFAELNPVPSLDWLTPLSEERYLHADLSRFGVPPIKNPDKELSERRFSLLNRPPPYHLAPRMSLADGRTDGSQWDNVMNQLAQWLTRHLNDPELPLWLVKHGGHLSNRLTRLIEERLDVLANLERLGKLDELASIQEAAPNAIPSQPMRALWRLLITGQARSWRRHETSLYDWRKSFRREGLSTALRLQLREILKPRVSLGKQLPPKGTQGSSSQPQNINDLIRCEIVLSTDYAHTAVETIKQDAGDLWTKSLPELLPDFNNLLRDAMDLMKEIGIADEQSDLSYIQQPSISPHEQNNDRNDWTLLIDLTRDAWLETLARFPRRAALMAESWSHTPYPLFRRLTLFAATEFAATESDAIPPRQAIDWLLADEHRWLWCNETRREAMRLMVGIAPRLDAVMLHELEKAVLSGPPRKMYSENIPSETWDGFTKKQVWIRLKKMDEAGAKLSMPSLTHLKQLSQQHPEWCLYPDQRDEFAYWMEMGVFRREAIHVPRNLSDLVKYLKANQNLPDEQEDDWSTVCKDNLQVATEALRTLAQEDIWPTTRWNVALWEWSEKALRDASWQSIAPVIAQASDETLKALNHGITWWLKAAAKSLCCREDIFFRLVQRILDQDHPDNCSITDAVTDAINHPVGLITEALLNWWYRRPLEDDQGLPEKLKPVFADLCNPTISKFRHARVLLATHVITLFRVDQDWTTEHLLPLFNWQNAETKAEAHAVWKGLLWTPRLHYPLLTSLKKDFLETAQHYEALGEHGNQYASLLTFAALDPRDSFSTTELATATRALPPDGLHKTAQTLTKALNSAAEQHEEYWKNRILPYLDKVWPTTRDKRSPEIASSFGNLCISARNHFPEALERLAGWLAPPPARYYALLRRLYEGTKSTEENTQEDLPRSSNLCKDFPDHALQFLLLILADQIDPWMAKELRACLEIIKQAKPDLEHEWSFQKLMNYARQHESG